MSVTRSETNVEICTIINKSAKCLMYGFLCKLVPTLLKNLFVTASQPILQTDVQIKRIVNNKSQFM